MSFFFPDNLRAVTGGRWLQRAPQSALLDGVGVDTREDLDRKIFIAIKGDNHDGHDFLADAAKAGAGMLLVEREAIGKLPDDVGVLLVSDTRTALGRLARAYRRSLRLTKVIAITGSAGKTTTKQLVNATLSTTMRGRAAIRSFNNDIGVPLTVLSARPTDQFLIVEIGTSGPGEVAHLAQICEPNIAIITGAGHSHLEGLGTVDDVAREKLALLAYLREGGLAIVNADEPRLRAALKTVPTVVLYGEAEDADLRLTGRGVQDSQWWFELNHRQRFKLGLPGRHNASNALAAVAVARRFGIVDLTVSEALGRSEPPAMRMSREIVGDLRVYNDAYNANPESMAAALETFMEIESAATRRVLVLGDMLELGEAGPDLHTKLGERLAEIDRDRRIDHVVLVGKLSTHTAKPLREQWGKDRITRIVQLGPTGYQQIRRVMQPGDAVLVKGSRSIGLEAVVRELGKKEERHEGTEGRHEGTKARRHEGAKKTPAAAVEVKPAAKKTGTKKPVVTVVAKTTAVRKKKTVAKKAAAKKAPVRKKTAARKKVTVKAAAGSGPAATGKKTTTARKKTPAKAVAKVGERAGAKTPARTPTRPTAAGGKVRKKAPRPGKTR